MLSGPPRLGFVSFTRKGTSLGGKKMAWNSEKYDVVCAENKAGLVFPASEVYAEEACGALRAGKVIAVPTDTLYGFACDAWCVSLVFF